MKYIIQGILVIALLFMVSFLHPLNAKLPTVYVFTPVDKIVQLKDIKAIYTNVYWQDKIYIKDIIDVFYKDGNEAAKATYKRFKNTDIVVSVYAGYVPVVFVEEYKGYWIFAIDR